MPRSNSLRLSPFRMGLIALSVSASFLSVVPTALAQSASPLDDLLERLKSKGVLTEDEYNEMRSARDEEIKEQRAERRKRALREALDTEAKEKQREAAPTQTQGRFREGFTWESGDRSSSLNISGRAHADYRNFSPDVVSADTFDMRRAYLTVAGKMYDYVTFDVTGDFAQTTTPQLDVAWVNFAMAPAAQLRFGQFKMPFSLEELGSSRFLDFQERSLVNGLVPQKERGMMLWGAPTAGVSYGLALSTGQGKNNNDIVSAKAKSDLIARVVVNAAELLDRKDSVLHFGLSYSDGELPANFGLSQRTEGRGVTFFNTQSFSGTNVERVRMGADASLAFGPVKLQGEYVTANYQGNASGADYDRDISAFYVEALWMITGERYADSYRNNVYGRILPKTNYAVGASGWGAFEVGLRFSSYDAGDFTATNASGTGRLASATGGTPQLVTPTNKATATTLGLKWILNPNFKFYLNYVHTKFDTPITVNPNYASLPNANSDDEKAVTFRAAVDF